MGAHAPVPIESVGKHILLQKRHQETREARKVAYTNLYIRANKPSQRKPIKKRVKEISCAGLLHQVEPEVRHA